MIDDKTTVSASDLGRVLNLTARRVRQLHEEGVFPRSERGRYPLAACVQAYVATIEAASDPEELKRERIELMRAQRARIEQDLRDRQANDDELDDQDRLIRALASEAGEWVRLIPGWLYGTLAGLQVQVGGMNDPSRELSEEVRQWCIGIRAKLEEHFVELAARARRKRVALRDEWDIERLELPAVGDWRTNGNGSG